jgi:hypothetical protein
VDLVTVTGLPRTPITKRKPTPMPRPDARLGGLGASLVAVRVDFDGLTQDLQRVQQMFAATMQNLVKLTEIPALKRLKLPEMRAIKLPQMPDTTLAFSGAMKNLAKLPALPALRLPDLVASVPGPLPWRHAQDEPLSPRTPRAPTWSPATPPEPPRDRPKTPAPEGPPPPRPAAAAATHQAGPPPAPAHDRQAPPRPAATAIDFTPLTRRFEQLAATTRTRQAIKTKGPEWSFRLPQLGPTGSFQGRRGDQGEVIAQLREIGTTLQQIHTELRNDHNHLNVAAGPEW